MPDGARRPLFDRKDYKYFKELGEKAGSHDKTVIYKTESGVLKERGITDLDP